MPERPSIPRYSREDFADATAELIDLAKVLPNGAPAQTKLRLAAAMLSEAANRAPTHAELVKQIKRIHTASEETRG